MIEFFLSTMTYFALNENSTENGHYSVVKTLWRHNLSVDDRKILFAFSSVTALLLRQVFMWKMQGNDFNGVSLESQRSNKQ